MILPEACELQFRLYQRQLLRPLQTHHGWWKVREGIVLKLTDQAGQGRWGEIAPIPWFGSETLEQALEFCQQLPDRLSWDQISAIPDHLPACQFGFESAWLKLGESAPPTLPLCTLLPMGESALDAWKSPCQRGQRHFKWKIGVAAIADELSLLEQLVERLPAAAQLRLDANGGLSLEETQKWLRVCDRLSIEFLEQPLPPDRFDAMLKLAADYATPLALDESVANLADLKTCYQRGWRGVFVIKPAIVGYPARLRQFCQDYPIDAVFSSALETPIGRRAGLNLAAELSNPKRAIGYGTAHWFAADSDPDDFEQRWQRL